LDCPGSRYSASFEASEPFGPWIKKFWSYETSRYIAERLAHGQRATKRHCQDMKCRAKEIGGLLPDGITLGRGLGWF
jgi:hypothetical protein